MRRKGKGFTLIEILIVIVILAVLASLVLPRMMSQPERALVAEAVNYLGVIRRSQESIVGSISADWITGAATAGTDGNDGWKDMGMAIVPANSSFSYSCVGGLYASQGLALGAAGTCTATRANVNPVNNARNGGTITISLNTGRVTACGAPYMMLGAANAVGTSCA